jgi:hypothetical protein
MIDTGMISLDRVNQEAAANCKEPSALPESGVTKLDLAVWVFESLT